MPPLGTDGRSLKIIHVLRAPLGGLFRHVIDLAREQIARGHRVGLITDSVTGGERADATLRAIEPELALGLSRIAMHRNPHPSDLLTIGRVMAITREFQPDVVHGHGSKGGLFARAPGLMAQCLPGDRQQEPVRAYTPHGGSFNFQPGTRLHGLYMRVEATLAHATDILLFESAYIGRRFNQCVGAPDVLKRTVLNGIGREEFGIVAAAPDAADFLYVGELRSAKGIDTLLDALAALRAATNRDATAVLVGSGPDEAKLTAQASQLGLAESIRFLGPMPARKAFALGRTMIVPSRAESLPYIVLEAAAARVQMIATDVGGIPEIFGPYADRLIPSNDVAALTQAMLTQSTLSPDRRQARAGALRAYVAERFTIIRMVDAVLSGYQEAIAAKTARHGGRQKAFAVPS